MYFRPQIIKLKDPPPGEPINMTDSMLPSEALLYGLANLSTLDA